MHIDIRRYVEQRQISFRTNYCRLHKITDVQPAEADNCQFPESYPLGQPRQ